MIHLDLSSASLQCHALFETFLINYSQVPQRGEKSLLVLFGLHMVFIGSKKVLRLNPGHSLLHSGEIHAGDL